MRHTGIEGTLAITALSALLGVPARADIPPDYDFGWAVIDHAGNAGYDRDPASFNFGRGSVGYDYRITTDEVTTAQWMEYANTFTGKPGVPADFAKPVWWGATLSGGQYQLRPVANAAMIPVRGISWRDAALYVNWLENGKSNDYASTQHGVYDASTFGWSSDGSFSDQLYHAPGAKFWIPTLDEWIKSVHFDPAKTGGLGGWWEQPNGSDVPLIPGAPGIGQTSAGYEAGFPGEWDIPLGAYPATLSPWGLLDASGGGAEWLEESYAPYPQSRGIDGAPAGLDNVDADRARSTDYLVPTTRAYGTLRLASAVPSPSTLALVVAGAGCFRRRRVACT